MNTEQPSRNQNFGPLCSLECGSLLPPLFVWSCSGSGKAQASLRTPKRTRQECCKNPCQVAKDFRLSSTEASGFSVHLRVLCFSVVNEALEFFRNRNLPNLIDNSPISCSLAFRNRRFDGLTVPGYIG